MYICSIFGVRNVFNIPDEKGILLKSGAVPAAVSLIP